ncbi:c-type cytochrome [Flaviflagellibacter deserti]|uniref:C-type cytochrome n=1 Tax=Flaviflagellibacter deserti TaxID=2267266 RepID=A0ABV9YZV3_9HYPH
MAFVLLVGLGVAAAFLFAASGVYNVAASRGHWWIVDQFLRFGMENSVKARAPETSPNLDDADLIRLGAAHFHGGCAFCHGAPGSRPSPVVQHMLPSPPDLAERVDRWTDGELFWLVKHGLKYAGMPAWPAQDRDDEIWSVVAFLRQLPDLDARHYEELALAEVQVDGGGGRELATAESDPDGVGACARCHGDAGRGPQTKLVPRLQGQSRDWLARSLRDYAEGARHSGIMQPLAAALKPEAIEKLATYYAGLPPLAPDDDPRRGSVEEGQKLATSGDPGAEIPACISCHGSDGSPDYPRLAGQPARYLSAQLAAWRNGKGGTSPTHAIMAPIAARLTDQQIADVSAFFASQRVVGHPGLAP